VLEVPLRIKSYTNAMHKKLTKYIERYEVIEACTSYGVVPNGGMIVLINYGTKCEVTISQTSYTLGNL
jgi:hypothetical protein